MSTTLTLECTSVPVTALASSGTVLIAAEGPYLRFFNTATFKHISSVRIFKGQAIHGIAVYSQQHDVDIRLVVWGGRLVRALTLFTKFGASREYDFDVRLSNVELASDWILDLAPLPHNYDVELVAGHKVCVAVTAHNALLQIRIHVSKTLGLNQDSTYSTLAVSELTPSSRSILYSAHLLWASPFQLLIAAGTAFGEIIYWSWSDDPQRLPEIRMHRVFLGHEGSIFGVRISDKQPFGDGQDLKRCIVSCSDDRTIRIWDVSDLESQDAHINAAACQLNNIGAGHTGFSNAMFDSPLPQYSQHLAIGWGHISRIWKVDFLSPAMYDGRLYVLSAGEDATTRLWELVPNREDSSDCPYKLLQRQRAAYHDGKNIWSICIQHVSEKPTQLFCGGADGKITVHQLQDDSKEVKSSSLNSPTGFTLQSAMEMIDLPDKTDRSSPQSFGKPLMKNDFFRSYCLVNDNIVLITTNYGKIFRASLSSQNEFRSPGYFSTLELLAQLEDCIGHSTCVASPISGMAFLVGAKGDVYSYLESTKYLQRIHSLQGKVGNVFTSNFSHASSEERVVLLISPVAKPEAYLIYIGEEHDTEVRKNVGVPILPNLTGAIITSMTYLSTTESCYTLLGFRRGSIAIYSLPHPGTEPSEAMLTKVLPRVHGEDAVTELKWVASSTDSARGYLYSVGRNAQLIVHFIDLVTVNCEMVHRVALPVGPNIEGLFIHKDNILVHGFTSKNWILYNVSLEKEVINVEIGGAHRTWAFRPHSAAHGGTLIWTRASEMYVHSQLGPSHTVLRPGGHGREIKAVAVSPQVEHSSPSQLIATGAEDTNVKLFHYQHKQLTCQVTIQQHTTGIQHLQWSEDGSYLFSSGGCEEFFIWRVRNLPLPLMIGVVCEHTYTPESKGGDLRITSFDVLKKCDNTYNVAMVLSDSSLKFYSYNANAAIKWQPLARGIYFNSCLTQCSFLSSSEILTAGTDGHAVNWSLPLRGNEAMSNSSSSVAELTWQVPLKMHQSSSKTFAVCSLGEGVTLILSGGDDGSLAFLLKCINSQRAQDASQSLTQIYSPILLRRIHASAVTASTIINRRGRCLILTSGNDQWVRLWEANINDPNTNTNAEQGERRDWLSLRRLDKFKTSIADVSGIVELKPQTDDEFIRILVCGVGMQVIQIENRS